MKIPSDAIISAPKLTDYLLVLRARNDKSKFLAQGGFTMENYQSLDFALRELLKLYDAIEDRRDEYGTFYQVIGFLQGIDGTLLGVTTIWLQRKVDRQFQFVTLLPNKEVVL